MNPHQIKRLFPGASKSLLAANAKDYGPSDPRDKLSEFVKKGEVRLAQETADVSFTIPGQPVGKPRMTQRDKWSKRPCVMRYRAWADKARESAGLLMPDKPYSIRCICYLEIPKSYGKQNREAMRGQMHRLRGDVDNFLKAAMDALLEQDGVIAITHAEKYWDDGNGPRIEVTVI